METSIYSFETSGWNGEQDHGLLHACNDAYEQCLKVQQSNCLDTAYWSDIERLLCSDFSFNQHADDVNVRLSSDKGTVAPTESCVEPIIHPDHGSEQMDQYYPYHDQFKQLGNGLVHRKKRAGNNFKPLASLEILTNYRAGGQLKRLQGERLDGANFMPRPPPAMGGPPERVLSTEEVMRVAGARYIQFADQRPIVVEDEKLAALAHPFGFMLSSLPEEETKDVELAHLLLAAAEKVANQQVDRASRLLTQCELFSSALGNPVQRLVYYFADALRERIDKAMGGWCKKEPGVVALSYAGEEAEEKMKVAWPSLVALHQLLPFSNVVQFTAVQAILNVAATRRKIHLLDLNIRIGLHWTVLLQGLSESRQSSSPLELVKITAVATSQEASIADTGARLTNFAAGFGLRLVFKTILVADMKELREGMFERDEEETLVVYASLVLRTMLVSPASLDNLMRVARRLRPALMTVVEVEADHNSLSFNRRFIEALFFYSAWFDCFDAAMAPNDPNRIDVEAGFFAAGIRSIVAAEGPERVVRQVRLEVWRSFMTRFGFEEVELGQMIFYQAGLILDRYGFGSRCTVDTNGKGMTTGWKGTPFMSVSAWKVK